MSRSMQSTSKDFLDSESKLVFTIAVLIKEIIPENKPDLFRNMINPELFFKEQIYRIAIDIFNISVARNLALLFPLRCNLYSGDTFRTRTNIPWIVVSPQQKEKVQRFIMKFFIFSGVCVP